MKNKDELDQMFFDHSLQKIADSQFRYDAQQGMIRFGGSFLGCLGETLAHADAKNTYKIMSLFWDECKEHADLWIKYNTLANMEE